MLIHSIVNVTPIVLPELLYIDRFNNRNAYVDMNPSLHISEYGEVKILVRRVNYRKFNNRHFILYRNKSESEYVILTGNIGDKPLSIENFTLSTLKNNYSIKTYSTYWTGIEDIRFITDSSILTVIPECNPSGQPCIFRAHLDNTTVHSHTMCNPNITEKNWMPYIDNEGRHKVIYSLFPLTIKSIDIDDRQTLPSNISTLEGYHGSTNGINYNNERLFLVHSNKERTYHRWILFNPSTYTLRASEPFVFFKHSHIEFTCSLASFKDRIFVSIGVNDNSAYILELDRNEIQQYIPPCT
jgi:hypothetical protein